MLSFYFLLYLCSSAIHATTGNCCSKFSWPHSLSHSLSLSLTLSLSLSLSLFVLLLLYLFSVDLSESFVCLNCLCVDLLLLFPPTYRLVFGLLISKPIYLLSLFCPSLTLALLLYDSPLLFHSSFSLYIAKSLTLCILTRSALYTFPMYVWILAECRRPKKLIRHRLPALLWWYQSCSYLTPASDSLFLSYSLIR